MLPIIGAAIHYPDGSVYRVPDDGAWAEAPPFAVQAVVFYHVDGGRHVSNGLDVYHWEGDYEGRLIKIGLWHSPEGYYRIIEQIRGEWGVTP